MKRSSLALLSGVALGLLGLMSMRSLAAGLPTPFREDQQERSQLQGLARISPARAAQVARSVHTGPIASVKLESEDGSLVYAVVSGDREILVDAGNGTLLSNRPAAQENGEGRPRSSLQVPDGDHGQEDAEPSAIHR